MDEEFGRKLRDGARAQYLLEKAILNEITGSRRRSMEKYFFDKTDVVRFVSALLKHLPRGSRLSTTISREKSGDWLVHTATDTLSDDTDENTSLSSKG